MSFGELFSPTFRSQGNLNRYCKILVQGYSKNVHMTIVIIDVNSGPIVLDVVQKN